MADARFYTLGGPFDLEELGELTGSKVKISNSQSIKYTDVAALSEATKCEVSFIDNRKYLPQFQETNAGAVVVHPDNIDKASTHTNLLISVDPYRAYAKIARAFYPIISDNEDSNDHQPISPHAVIGENVVLGFGVVVKENARIGDNSVIGTNSVVGKGVKIGKDTTIGANAILRYCLIGERAIIHSGVSIGQDGFGFVIGKEDHEKVPQLGKVVIGDDVEIGANSCIDRGASTDTVIEDGTKIDNLVQIAHNVRVGKSCLIAAQVGIAGSSQIGDQVMIGGQAGVSGHLVIGNGVRIAAKAGVTKNIASGETVAGFPAINARSYWKNLAVLNNIKNLTKS